MCFHAADVREAAARRRRNTTRSTSRGRTVVARTQPCLLLRAPSPFSKQRACFDSRAGALQRRSEAVQLWRLVSPAPWQGRPWRRASNCPCAAQHVRRDAPLAHGRWRRRRPAASCGKRADGLDRQGHVVSFPKPARIRGTQWRRG